jgi:hypothetical protein
MLRARAGLKPTGVWRDMERYLLPLQQRPEGAAGDGALGLA